MVLQERKTKFKVDLSGVMLSFSCGSQWHLKDLGHTSGLRFSKPRSIMLFNARKWPFLWQRQQERIPLSLRVRLALCFFTSDVPSQSAWALKNWKDVSLITGFNRRCVGAFIVTKAALFCASAAGIVQINSGQSHQVHYWWQLIYVIFRPQHRLWSSHPAELQCIVVHLITAISLVKPGLFREPVECTITCLVLADKKLRAIFFQM